MQYRYCPNCGTKVPTNIRFCPKCGHALNFNQAPNPQINQPIRPMPRRLQKKHHYGRWIIGIIVVLIVIVGGLVYFNSSSNNSNSPSTANNTTSSQSSNSPSKIHSEEYNNVNNVWNSVQEILINNSSGSDDSDSNENDKDYGYIDNAFVNGKSNKYATSIRKWIKLNIDESNNNKISYNSVTISDFHPSGNTATMKIHYNAEINTTGGMHGTRKNQKQVFLWTATFDKNTHKIKKLIGGSKPLSQSSKTEHETKAEKEGIP